MSKRRVIVFRTTEMECLEFISQSPNGHNLKTEKIKKGDFAGQYQVVIKKQVGA